MRAPQLTWPDGKRFAFTIVDDTDRAELNNVRPVYDFLWQHGFRTTKTVWPLEARIPITGGTSLETPAYREWLLELRDRGFEIALHGVADQPSKREVVAEGLARFRAIFGAPPTMHINHVGQTEALYWGKARLNPPVRWLYSLYRRLHAGNELYLGHVPGSEYFWGDLCAGEITFVRNLLYPGINTARLDPLMPYHDPRRPYVRYWFSSSYGSGIKAFLRLLSEKNQDKLMAEGGACIVYTHLGSGFYPFHDEFLRLMRRLAGLPGWFVPASTLLEHLGAQRGWTDVSRHRIRHAAMEFRWLIGQLLRNSG